MSVNGDIDVPVLIAGGSLVGLSTALLLAQHGIPSVTVERHPGTAIHPRAAMFNQRAIEVYRGAGLEDEIVEASRLEFEQDGAIVSVESLAGKELEYYFRNVNDGYETLSPSPRLFITQIGLEPILRRRAEELGARLEYSTELVSFGQDADGVTAVVRGRDGGAERTVRALYLVAADGTRSRVRERLGIPLLGHPSFSKSITIYFRADVRPQIGDRNLSVIYVFGPTLQGFFRFSLAGDAGFLAVNTTTNPDGTRNRDAWSDMSDDRCVAYVREALGAPDLAVEIENVQQWNACAEWAERFQEGRIFLAGDAAHTMPPTGGFGGNTGVADAHNLAWKLAFVLQGKAGPELLDTYDAERRPVGELTTEQAYTRYVLRLDPELGKEDIQPFVPDPPIELGHRYRSSAVIPEEGDDDSPHENPHEPSGRPGTRAPHLWLSRDGSPVSTLDLAARSFALLAGRDGGAWCDAAREAAAELGVPLDAFTVGAGAELPDDDEFATAYGTGSEGAVLVRPDGFIAWRATSAGDGAAVHSALALVLSRDPVPSGR
jgi:2-polyprenyl-6-methoxyphenol hydroxylase-like FAD-dependent oxidoreductase